MKLLRPPIESDLLNPGTQAYRWRKFQRTSFCARFCTGFCASRLHFEPDVVRRPLIIETHCLGAYPQMVDGKRTPIRWNVRSKNQVTSGGVGFNSQKTAQKRIDNHSRGPDLMGRAGGERLIVLAGKNFGNMAERPV